MRYIDKDYDGVVINLPSAFIEMNGLGPALAAFEEELKKAKLSTMLPDYENSLYEIANYKGKKEYLAEKKRQREESIKRERERKQKLLNRDIICCVWKDDNIFDTFHNDELELNGETINLWEYLYQNNRTLIRSKLLNLNNQIVKFIDNSVDNYIKFMEENGFHHTLRENFPAKYFNQFFKITNNVIYQDNYSTFQVRFKRLYAQIWVDNEHYYEVPFSLTDTDSELNGEKIKYINPILFLRKKGIVLDNILEHYEFDNSLNLIRK